MVEKQCIGILLHGQLLPRQLPTATNHRYPSRLI